ncbi:transposase [Liquorilactobacillus ghanensis]|uniref:transposase n=1 Tax=Liquorilactobacillus ghanensis TaxID=399370 RepID=UPI0039E912EA
MSKRKKYSVEFKKMIVQLYESRTSVTDFTSEYGITSATIYKWNDLYICTRKMMIPLQGRFDSAH